MPYFARTLALVGAACFFSTAAEAATLTLALGELRREPAAGTVANVVVGDPAVADVTVIDQHSVVIVGKGVGATEVLATDRAGRVLIDDQVTIGGLGQRGRVTVYRGLASSDYTCTPNCATADAQAFRNSAASASQPSSESSSQPMNVAPPVSAQAAAPLHP